MKISKINSVQNWLPFDKVLENGVIKLKNNSLVKILIISPINFNLKSKLEKESILNSYKIFLKTCNFNLQILIQSNKEDLTTHISNIENANKKEKDNIVELSQNYINFIQNINKERKSSSKNFYILIKEVPKNKRSKFYEDYSKLVAEARQEEIARNKKRLLDANEEKILCNKLNDNYFKIKECLSRCGNQVSDSKNKESTEKILYSFFNNRKELFEV